MLADMGAEVIKVESVEGETMRTRPPVRNGSGQKLGHRGAFVDKAADEPAGLRELERVKKHLHCLVSIAMRP